MGARYIDRTLTWARGFHARGLMRARVSWAHVEHFDPCAGKAALSRVVLGLVDIGGRWWRSVDVVVPTRERPNARETFAATIGSVVSARKVLDMQRGALIPELRGLWLDVAVRDGCVVWIRRPDAEEGSAAE